MGDKHDVLIPLNQDSLDRHLRLMKAGSCVVYDSDKLKPGEAAAGVQLCPMPMKQICGANKLAANTAALGAVLQLMGIEAEPLETVICKAIQEKGRGGGRGKRRDRAGWLRLCRSTFQAACKSRAQTGQAQSDGDRQPGNRHGRGGRRGQILCRLSHEPFDRGTDVDGFTCAPTGDSWCGRWKTRSAS